MSTKSLDLSLPLSSRQQFSQNDELSSLLLTKEHLKSKLDFSKIQCYEELGAKLIEDRLLLTALELYAELGEAGHEIVCLKQFFSNPGNFEKSAKASGMLVRSMSQTTLDSLDFQPISEDGDRAGGDRVAVLEFELRKAKETITALRENLTQQVELENASTRSETESISSQNNPVTHQNTPEPMKAYEQRAINFLVHEYLLTHGYRLTSITFADENTDQDFEYWDDVGLNVERPADLLTIYRHRFRPAGQVHIVQTENTETQTEDAANESSDLTMQLGGSAEESVNNSYDVSSVPSITKTEVKVASLSAYDIRESMITKPLSVNTSHASVQKSTSAVAALPIPVVSTRLESHHISPAFPQQAQLHNSARALKEELQQGVEDVCQKLNNFFNKPPSLSGGSLNKPMGFSHVKPPDRSSFSLFNSK
ncbi:uncharacterized protein LOC130691733 [Daphnia carinata]|uniref:uncharacterized protein LOC130691733 n=1 Tax=Daphnia carinata TaxID=120202 RepID=UPI002579EF39|nr:uncharacterized protein LOC130691733 [Daphnia carinata]